MKKDSIICFSLIAFCLVFFAGCISVKPSPVSGKKWEFPPKPKLVKVGNFQPVDGGFYISETNAVSLVNNVDELKAYIEKLETLVEKMKEYYK